MREDSIASGGLLVALGREALTLVETVGALVSLIAQVVIGVGRTDGRETIRHLERFCLGALPVFLGGALIIGGIVAMQGLGYVNRYNATEVFGWAAGMSSYREVGPLLLGMTLAARIGSKNTAELASMRSRERLSALSALGLDPRQVVFAPRIWAVVLSAAVIYTLATSTIFFTSVVVAAVLGGQLFSVSWYAFTEYQDAITIVEGFLRLCFFGLWTGACSTWFGSQADAGARGVGRAVYRASVWTFSGIVFINMVLSFGADL